MQIKREYESKFFEKEAIRLAIDHVKSHFESIDESPVFQSMNLKTGVDNIDFDCTAEGLEEFLNMYNENVTWAYLTFGKREGLQLSFNYHRYGGLSASTQIGVEATTKATINKALRIFETTDYFHIIKESKKPKIKPSIFLGHGRNDQWITLKNHLQDKHDIKVIAYETGARSGHAIRDILDEMTQKATMAFLIHTAEDELVSGAQNARPNVIHETGLFQGKLGFPRAIVVLEDGCEEYSNLGGIQQIRYSKGNIREVFGEVLATIRREFGNL